MLQNSINWCLTNDSSYKQALHTSNEEIAKSLCVDAIYEENTGRWSTYAYAYMGNYLTKVFLYDRQRSIDSIIPQMKKNSIKWFIADNKNELEDKNTCLAHLLPFETKYYGDSGLWYSLSNVYKENQPLYVLEAQTYFEQMKDNSRAWCTSSDDKVKTNLHEENIALAETLRNIDDSYSTLRYEDGWWYITDSNGKERAFYGVAECGNSVASSETSSSETSSSETSSSETSSSETSSSETSGITSYEASPEASSREQ